MTYRPYLMIIILILGFGACDNDDHAYDVSQNCDFNTIVSADLYDNEPTDLVSIINLEINNNCLEITFGASGCDGSSFEVKLIDSEQILESFPAQRNLKLTLDNNEDCTAFIQTTLSFDISELQLPDEDQVYLNINSPENQILYDY